MNNLLKFAVFVGCFTLLVSAQTSKDFSLKAGDGKTYSLYTLLGQGKHVLIHFTSTN